MKKNPFDQFDKPSQYLPEGEDESLFVDRINRRIKAETKVKSMIPLRWMVGIAACLFMASVYFLMTPEALEMEQLSEAYFIPYKNYQFEKTRGSKNEGDLKLAYDVYDKQDYTQAIKYFEPYYNALTPLDQLYYAISLQGISQWSTSADVLNKIENEIPPEHKSAWAYYTSLSIIAIGKTSRSQDLLKSLIDTPSPFKLKAIRLLGEFK